MIFSVEEHNIIGGLGSAIAEHQLSLKTNVRFIRLGIKDKYGSGGSYDYLQKIHGPPSPEKIVENILINYQKNE